MTTSSRRPEEPGTELGAFLRARRSKLDPGTVGLAETGGPRRVPGLRREEVAQLAAISTDYYTRLEQGRLPGASPAVLNALATALRLGPDERSYLYRLANKSDRQPPSGPRTERVLPHTRMLLDNLRDSPAVLLGPYLDVLAWNGLATAVFTDFAALPGASATSCACSSSTPPCGGATWTGPASPGSASRTSAPRPRATTIPACRH